MSRTAFSSTLLILLSASLILIVASCGDGGGPTEPDPPPPGSITVSVRVTASGVSGVTVSLQGPSSGSATTDGNGSVTFQSLAAGTYTVSISNYPSDHYFPITSSSASVPRGVESSTSVSFEGSRLLIRTESLPEAFVGKEYSAQLEADGGSGSYSWSLASGSLPDGLSLSSKGKISGTPTTAESTSFTFRVGSGGAETSRDLAFRVSVREGLILGIVYYDRNHDGMPNAGEGLADLTLVFLSDDAVQGGDTVSTSSDGSYSVLLAPGSYTVVFPSLPDTLRADPTPTFRASPSDTIRLHIGLVVVQEIGGLSLPISTHVLDSASAATIHTPDGGATITAPQNTAGMSSLVPGDILVAGITETTPQGLLRKIESVSTTGDRITLTTVQATLEEAICEGSFAVRRTLYPADLLSFQAPEGVSLVQGNSGSEFSVKIDQVLFDEDGNHQTTNDQIRLDGEIRFVPTAILEGEFRRFRLRSARAGIELDLESGLELTWSHRSDKALEIKVAEFFFAAIPFGPFVFFPSIDVRVGVEGGVEAALNASLEYSANALAVVQLRDGAWNGISSWSDEVSGALNASFSASASAFVRVPVRFELYSVAGPHAGVKTYVEGIVNPLSNPWWELFFGVTGQAGFEMTVFSLFEAGVNLDLFDYRKTIRDAGGPLDSLPGRMIDLGSLGGSSSYAWAVNDAGQVVGVSSFHAFLWENGVMRDLGTLGGLTAIASDINNAGQVVGWNNYNIGVRTEGAFLLENGSRTDLGTLGGSSSEAHAINGRSQVAGTSYDHLGHSRAFLWEDGAMLELGGLGGISSIAHGINDSGQVVGRVSVDYRNSLAFLWEDGVMINLGSLGGNHTEARGVNNTGQVVGQSINTSGDWRAFLWEDGVMKDLGTLGRRSSGATAINDVGQVVGWSDLASGERRATLWQNGVMFDLGTLGGPDSAALGINNLGQVVGWSRTNSGEIRPFLWTPMPG